MNSTADNKTKTQVTRRRAFSPKDRLTLGVFIGVPTAGKNENISLIAA